MLKIKNNILQNLTKKQGSFENSKKEPSLLKKIDNNEEINPESVKNIIFSIYYPNTAQRQYILNLLKLTEILLMFGYIYPVILSLILVLYPH